MPRLIKVIALSLLLLTACGGDESSSDAQDTSGSSAERSVPASFPASLDRDEYRRLTDELDELPDRVVPRVPDDEKLTFESEAAATSAFIDAISAGDVAAADRILASVAAETRNNLLIEAANTGSSAKFDDKDYARAYRFDAYVRIDYSQMWQLDAGFIRGRVTDAANGQPVSGASIRTQLPSVNPAVTAGNGTFELLVPEQLAHILFVRHEGYDELSQYEAEDGTRLMLEELGDRVLQLQLVAVDNTPLPELPSLTLRGQVVDAATSQPLPNITIVVAPEGHNTFDILANNYGYTTGDDGRFEIPDLPGLEVGMHAQGVHDGKIYFFNEEAVSFEDGVDQLIHIEGKRGELQVPVVVVGFVRDRTSGVPIGNARVSAGGWKAERTGPDGRFLIQLDPGKDWQLTADHEAYHESPSQAFSSPKPAKFETEFLLDPITTGTILGTAIDAVTGAPIANAVIEIAGQQVRTDQQGRFRVNEVESGDITVSGAQSGYRSDAAALVLEALQTAEATLELEPITTGTIRGIVTDASTGAPLAEAAVGAGDQRTSTDADGRFLLEDVEAGMLEVAASKAVYVPNSSNVALEAMADIETRVELTPITWGSVSGVVRDINTQQPLAGATVRIGGQTVTTNNQGEFQLERVPAGDVSLTASLDRYFESGAALELPRDGDAQQNFELAPITTGTLTGVVRDASTNAPVAGAKVNVGALAITTDANGQFSFADVPAGDLTVRATADVYEPAATELVLEAARTASTELMLVPITYGTVRGNVTDKASGSALANVSVRIGGNVIKTRADGTFVVERVPAGEISVTAERLRYYPAQQTEQLKPAADIDVAIELDPITTGTIRGTVTDAATGRGLPGVTVIAGSASAKTSTDGSFAIEDVPAGDVTLRAAATLYESAEHEIEVLAAETAEQDLAMTPVTYGTIVVSVVEKGSGNALADAQVTAGRERGRTDTAGSVTLEKIAAGTVAVTASRPIYVDDEGTLELAAGETLSITLELEAITWGALRGTVTDAETGRPLANAEVTAGTATIRTDSRGQFALDRTPAGSLPVAASAPAYESVRRNVQLEADGTADVTLELTPIKHGDVSGQVIDARTGEPISGARVTLDSQADESDATGRFQFTNVRIGTRSSAARHPDYANGSAATKVMPAETVEVTIRLDLRREDVTNLEAGLAASGTIDLYGIYFDSGRDQFKPSSLPTLRAVLEVMKRAPDRRFQIAGHTDSDGSESLNQDLSERRAKSVIDWLVNNGIERARLEAAGFGEARPAAPNDTESGKALNRRVQLRYGG